MPLPVTKSKEPGVNSRPKWAQWEFSGPSRDKFGCRIFDDNCLCLLGLPGNKEQITAILGHRK